MDAQLPARRSTAPVGGLLYAPQVVGDEQLRATGPEGIVRRCGDLLQPLIDPAAQDPRVRRTSAPSGAGAAGRPA